MRIQKKKVLELFYFLLEQLIIHTEPPAATELLTSGGTWLNEVV